MVKEIYLTSYNEGVGKTLIAIGLIQKFKKEGLKVEYFKPIGEPIGAYSNKSDRDVAYIFMNLVETTYDMETVCPVSINLNYYVDAVDVDQRKEYTEKIKIAYEKIKQSADVVVIEGTPNFSYFCRVGLDDLTIATELGIDGLYYVDNTSSDNFLDVLCFSKNYFDHRDLKIKGVIMNQIDFDFIPRIKELVEKHMKKYDIPLIGTLEKEPLISEPTVEEIQASIGGELINNPPAEALKKRVKSILIGAMSLDSAMKYFRQSKDAAVITGGDRSDLQLGALETNAVVLVLTGYIRPDTSIQVKADEVGVPILLSPSDTYTTLYNMDRIKPGLQPEEKEIALNMIEKHLDWNLLKP